MSWKGERANKGCIVKLAATVGPLVNPGKWRGAHMSERSSHPTRGRDLGDLYTNF